MIPIFFINLEMQPERCTWFAEQCASLGIEAIRVDAVNGRELSDQDLNVLRQKRRMDTHFGPAEIGCYLSHRRAWEYFLATEHDWGFIAEDDIHLALDSADFFQSTDWIPPDADVIKAESTFKKCHLGKSVKLNGNVRSLRRLLSLHGGGGGYFLNRRSAEALCNHASRIAEPVDLLIFDPKLGFFGENVVYQIDPAIGVQDLFFSHKSANFQKSSLELERQVLRKKSTKSKILRELKRPGLQLLNYIATQVRKFIWQSDWRSVPYAGSSDATPKIMKTRYK